MVRSQFTQTGRFLEWYLSSGCWHNDRILQFALRRVDTIPATISDHDKGAQACPERSRRGPLLLGTGKPRTLATLFE